MWRFAFSAALIALGGCAAGVDYGPYTGSYYTGAYALPGYAYGHPYGSVGLGGIWVGGGRGDWDRWHGFHGHHHWGAWHGGPAHAPGAWVGRGHWAGHTWHH
jgi:hypothetical protein